MKKCPMMLNGTTVRKPFNYNQPIGGRYGELVETSENYDCIGSKCAAYHQQNGYIGDDGKIVTGKMRWSCANLPREIWHDVEESK